MKILIVPDVLYKIEHFKKCSFLKYKFGGCTEHW